MKTPRFQSAIAWLLAVLLSASFVLAGVMKMLSHETNARRFEAWGYPGEFGLLIAVVEVAAGLLVLIPRVTIWAALGIAVLMIGAAGTHLVSGIGSPLFAFIYLGMAVGLAAIRWRGSAAKARTETTLE